MNYTQNSLILIETNTEMKVLDSIEYSNRLMIQFFVLWLSSTWSDKRVYNIFDQNIPNEFSFGKTISCSTFLNKNLFDIDTSLCQIFSNPILKVVCGNFSQINIETTWKFNQITLCFCFFWYAWDLLNFPFQAIKQIEILAECKAVF